MSGCAGLAERDYQDGWEAGFGGFHLRDKTAA